MEEKIFSSFMAKPSARGYTRIVGPFCKYQISMKDVCVQGKNYIVSEIKYFTWLYLF